MSTPATPCPRRRQETWTRAGAACLALLVSSIAAQAGELVIRAEDMALEVGSRYTMAITTPGGQPRGQLAFAIVGKRPLGNVALYRVAIRFNNMRVGESWTALSDTEFVSYSSFGAKHPDGKHPLPLRRGVTCEYESDRGKVRMRVEGPQEVQVPAGKFLCLVMVEERELDGQRWVEKAWMTPGHGGVKFAFRMGEDLIVSLVRHERPRQAAAKPGTDVFSTFDTGDLLSSPLFPRGRWNGVAGEPASSSVVEIDPFDGAAGSPFSLRWTYHAKGTWVSANLLPSGNPAEAVDLSRYGSASFYIKGLGERNCALSIQGKATDGDQRTMVNIPIQVTTQWRKVVIGPQTHPQLQGIDPRQVYIIGLGDFAQDEAANVIWIDEIRLHRTKQAGQF